MSLVLLGATGSIGTQTLEVAAGLGMEVAGLAAKSPSDRIVALAEAHPDAAIVVVGGAGEERAWLTGLLGKRVTFGAQAVDDLAAEPGHTVMNAMVGSAGLSATMAALGAGNRLALANKESLVAGGELVTGALAKGGGELIPVDSEHSAVLQCLVGEQADAVKRIILTASGGPFRGRTMDQMASVSPVEALQHPTWSMGRRITVDSATLLNKGLEVIEAHVLFGIGYDQIDVVVHPESVVHAMVEFVDGSVKAQIGEPDMRVPIQYALTHPERRRAPVAPLDLAGRALTFERPDHDAFPALSLAYGAGRRGGSAPATLNAADEVAVAAFLEGRLGFLGIPAVVERALDRMEWSRPASVEEVLAVDRESRAVAAELVGSC
jgi:1-deoxy-D-xylulose-5-phosphate reductoisomerase